MMEGAVIHTLMAFAPEAVLAVVALFLLVLGAVIGHRSAALGTGLAVAVLLLGAGVSAFLLMHPVPEGCFAVPSGWFDDSYCEGQMLPGFVRSMLVNDSFANFSKLVLLLGAAGSLLVFWPSLKRTDLGKPEYPVLVLLATLGMMVMVSAQNLLALYVGLELQSLSLYILVTLERDRPTSGEAGMKYFVMGAVTSGILLYGLSLIYGAAGGLGFADIAKAAAAGDAGEGFPLGLRVGLLFLVAGLAFKVAAVPFHMWVPDVYEGAPTPVTAFVAAVPKVAAFVVLVRLLTGPFAPLADVWGPPVQVMAVASMALGALAGMTQTNLKRLMGYSAIVHAGVALVGLASLPQQGPAFGNVVLIYVIIYAVTVLGVFGILAGLKRQGRPAETLDDLAGFGRSHPLWAAAFAIFLFSLAGVPPLAGFFAKYVVFAAAVEAHQTYLAVMGVLASLVSARYYLRVVRAIYFDEAAPGATLDPLRSVPLGLVTALAALAVVAFVIHPAILIR